MIKNLLDLKINDTVNKLMIHKKLQKSKNYSKGRGQLKKQTRF